MKHIEEAQKTFDARANSYDRETNWVQSSELIDPLIPALSKSIDDNMFLDVCTGTGSVAKRAFELGWNVFAIDQNVKMLEKIKSESNIRVFLCNGSKLPFKENYFDVVAMRQALHYFELKSTIKELARVCRGLVALGHITMFSQEDREIWAEYFRIASPGRLHIFHPGQISMLINKLGGEIITEKIHTSIEDFEGPLNHLGVDTVNTLKKLFLTSPQRFKKKYVISDKYNQDKFKTSIRWEFITAKF